MKAREPRAADHGWTGRNARWRLLVAALAVPLGLHAVSGHDGPPGRVPITEAPLEFSPADLVTATQRDMTPAVAFTGSLAAVVQTTLTAPFDGKLAEVAVRAGERVEAGQLLARLDDADLVARLSEMRAALAGAEEQLALAERNRASSLALLERRFISPNAYDNAVAGHADKVAAVEAQRARVAIAGRGLQDARILAPFSGVIASREAEPGQWVEPRRRLFTLVNLNRLELETAVAAEHLRAVARGQVAEFSVDGFASRRFAGRVARIGPVAQSGSRAVPVYIAVDNADGALRAGQFAAGRILAGAAEAAIVLPAGALQRRDGKDGVWTIADGRLAWRPVWASAAGAGQVRIDAGLEAGEQVVATALLAPKAGQPVVVRR